MIKLNVDVATQHLQAAGDPPSGTIYTVQPTLYVMWVASPILSMNGHAWFVATTEVCTTVK